MVAPEQTSGLEERQVGGDLGAGVAGHMAGDVGQHLSPLGVEAQHAGGAVEASPLQVAQQRVHGRRPRAGAAPNRAAYPGQGTEHARE